MTVVTLGPFLHWESTQTVTTVTDFGVARPLKCSPATMDRGSNLAARAQSLEGVLALARFAVPLARAGATLREEQENGGL